MSETLTLGDIATLVGGVLVGDAACLIAGAAPIGSAGKGEITFAEKGAAIGALASTKAAAIIVPRDTGQPGSNLIQVDNPRLAFSKVLSLFVPAHGISAGIHPSAVIGEDCTIGGGVAVGAGVVVGSGTVIGNRVVLYPNVVLGDRVVVGDDSVIYPNTSILERCTIGKRVVIHAGAVIGSDGFGFVFHEGRHHKIPQIGTVRVDDDVEIGANNTIDRGTMGTTWVKAGVKTDNLVHIAHNVEIGEHTIVIAQVGFAGSTTVGRYDVFAGQCGIGGHLTLGDGVTVGPQCAVAQSVPDGQTVSGTTLAMPHMIWLRLQKVLPDLPALFKRVRRLERDARKEGACKGGGKAE
jgi:UDP-3-O-[3-hydroxymyristoyl] glucosamine N-acyltransferase